MDIQFTADKVTCEVNTEENYYMIGFSDHGDAPDQYVILQRAVTFDEQDMESGTDTYYFEYSDQSYSGYGVCKNVAIENGRVFFELEEQVFDNIKSIEITFKQEDLTVGREEFEDVFNKVFSTVKE